MGNHIARRRSTLHRFVLATIHPLEARRLMTSQKLDAIDLDNIQEQSVGNDGAVYTLDQHAASTLDGLNRVDLATGSVTHIRPAEGLAPTRLDFFGAGRQFVSPSGTGFGWIDDDAGQVAVLADNESPSGEFMPAKPGTGYFATGAALGANLWFTDGTIKGTKAVASFDDAFDAIPAAYAGGRVFIDRTDLGEQRIYSYAPGEKKPRLELDALARYGGGADVKTVSRLGDGVLATIEMLNDHGPDTTAFCVIGADHSLKTLHVDSSLSAIAIITGYVSEVGATDTPINARDVLFTAYSSRLGYQIYSIDGYHHAVRRLSSFAKGSFDPDGVGDTFVNAYSLGVTRPGQDGDRRYVVSVRTDEDAASSVGNPGTFDPSVQPQSVTYLADVGHGTFTRLMDQAVTAVQSTSQGAFALDEDHSVWRIGKDAKSTFPVATRSDGLLLSGGDQLLMSEDLTGGYRTLRDTNAIVYGQAFDDSDRDLKRDATEWLTRAAGAFLDLNGDGKLSKHEPQAKAGENGSDEDPQTFYFDGLRAGTYHVGFTNSSYARASGAPRTLAVKVGDGATPSLLSIGVQSRAATLYVRAFHDTDGDGIWDKNEDDLTFQINDVAEGSGSSFEGSSNGYSAVVTDISPGKHTFRIRWMKSIRDKNASVLRTVTLHAGVSRLTLALSY